MKRFISIITIVLTFLPIGFNRQHSATGTIHDIHGNVYETVKIGNQWWITENLKVTGNLQGKPIKGYYFINDSKTYGIYGMLHTWKIVNTHWETNRGNLHGIGDNFLVDFQEKYFPFLDLTY